MKSLPLLTLAIALCLPACKTTTDNSKQIARLYGLPSVLRVSKGTEILTTEGVVIVPEDTLLHSHGSFMEQVRRNNIPAK